MSDFVRSAKSWFCSENRVIPNTESMAAKVDPEHDTQPFSRKRPSSPTPIDSRETVKRQALCATEIITLDDDDDEVTTEESNHESAQIRGSSASFQDSLSHARSDTNHFHDRTPRPETANLSKCQQFLDVMTPTPQRVAYVQHDDVAALKRTHISEPCQGRQSSTGDAGNESNWLDPPLLSHIEFTGETGLDYALERLRLLHTAVARDGSTAFTDNRLTVTTTTDRLGQNEEQDTAIRAIRSIREQKAASAPVTLRPLRSASSNTSSFFSEDSIDGAFAEAFAGDSDTNHLDDSEHRMHVASTRNLDKINGPRQAGSRQDYTLSRKRRQDRPHPHSSRGLREREQRLSERTAIRGRHSVNPLSATSRGRGKSVQEHTERTCQQPARFYGPLDSPPLRSRRLPSKDTLKSSRIISAAAGTINKGNEPDGNKVDSEGQDRADDPVPQDDSGQYSSNLRELLSDTPPPAPSIDDKDENWLSMFRPLGDLRDICLPKGFDDLSPERQQAIFEHENEKSRQKDLDALKAAINQWARNACTGDVRENELRDLQRYAIAVLDKSLSGKQQRSRIQNIKSSNRRRLERNSENIVPSKEQVQEFVNTVVSPQQLKLLMEERKRLKARVDELDVQRKMMKKATEQEKSNERRKQKFREGHGKRNEKTTAYAVAPALVYKSQFGKKSRGLTKQERIQQLQEKADKFVARERELVPTSLSTAENECTMSSEDEGGRTGDESEEEEGAEFLGIAKAESSSLAALEITDEAAQDESDTMEAGQPPNNISKVPTAGPGQTESDASYKDLQRQQHVGQTALDELLFDNLRRKRMYQKQQSKETEVVEQGLGEEIDCEVSDSGDDDLDLPDQDDHEDRIVMRYAVNACFRGFEERTDGDTYLIGHFPKLPAADEKLDEVISQAKQEYMNGTNEQRHLKTTLDQSYDDDNGYFRRLALKFGRDEEAQCVVWVEEQQHNLSEEAFQLAKTKRLFRKKPLWHVIWEKTEYYREIHADDCSSNEDTLVDEDPALPSQCVDCPRPGYKPPYIEEITEDEIQIFHKPAVDLFIECETTECHPTQSYRADADEQPNLAKLQSSNNGKGIDERLLSDAIFLSSAPFLKPSPQSPAPLPTLPTIIEHTAHQDIKAYTTIALANRAALARYLDWWYSALTPELKGDHAWLRSEENFLEEEVRRHGDRCLWESSKAEVVLGTEIIGGKHFEKVAVFWAGVRALNIYGPANTGYGK